MWAFLYINDIDWMKFIIDRIFFFQRTPKHVLIFYFFCSVHFGTELYSVLRIWYVRSSKNIGRVSCLHDKVLSWLIWCLLLFGEIWQEGLKTSSWNRRGRRRMVLLEKVIPNLLVSFLMKLRLILTNGLGRW